MKSDDLRVRKTDKALSNSMYQLLKKKHFLTITVNDICEDANVSRATFYAHYDDKYDLLSHCLRSIVTKIVQIDTYEQLESYVNQLVNENKTVIKNVFYHANSEIRDAVCLSVIASMDLFDNYREKDYKHIVLSNFFAGGVLWNILWQVKHGFPPDMELANKHIYELYQYFIGQ